MTKDSSISKSYVNNGQKGSGYMSALTQIDVVISGAGPVGCVAALLAQKIGLSVMMVEKIQKPLPRKCALSQCLQSQCVGILSVADDRAIE